MPSIISSLVREKNSRNAFSLCLSSTAGMLLLGGTLRTPPDPKEFRTKYEFQRPFIVEFTIRRRLRSARRTAEWGKELRIQPRRNQFDRWDLQVQFRHKGTLQHLAYHRLVCLSCVPCAQTRCAREMGIHYRISH